MVLSKNFQVVTEGRLEKTRQVQPVFGLRWKPQIWYIRSGRENHWKTTFRPPHFYESR